jgi:hypothetical protein
MTHAKDTDALHSEFSAESLERNNLRFSKKHSIYPLRNPLTKESISMPVKKKAAKAKKPAAKKVAKAKKPAAKKATKGKRKVGRPKKAK